jgi:hypothetical protein
MISRKQSVALATVAALFPVAGLSAPPEVTGAPPAEKGRLEVKVDGVRIPSGELLGWELFVDGELVAANEVVPVDPRPPEWAGMVRPGSHDLALRVRYWRDLKTVVSEEPGSEDQGPKVGFTFIAAGRRALGQRFTVEARSVSVVRLAAAVDDDPEAIGDRLVLSRLGDENSWVEIGDGKVWNDLAPDDFCDRPSEERGDDDLCALRTYARILGVQARR